MRPAAALKPALWLFCLALPVSIAGINIAAGLATAVLLAASLGSRPRSIPWRRAASPAVLALAVYCAVAVVVSLTGVAPEVSLKALYKDLHKLWIMALLLTALGAEPLPRAGALLAAGYAVISEAGLMQAAALGVHHLTMRGHGFVHPVTYGELLALGLLGGLCFYDRREAGTSSKTARRLMAVLLSLAGAALIVSQTRGALLGLAAGFGALCVLEPSLRRWGLRAAVAAALVVAAWEVIPTTRGHSLHSLWQNRELYLPSGVINPIFGRYALWGVALRIFRDHPWLGVGPGNFRTVFSSYYPGTIDSEGNWGSAHNLYLHQLAERGLLGLSALLLALGTLLVLAWRRARKNPNPWNLWAAGALAAFLVMNLTEVAFQNEQLTTLVLFLWAWAQANDGARA